MVTNYGMIQGKTKKLKNIKSQEWGSILDEINTKAVQAANDVHLMDSFVEQNELFILRCASAVVHRYVTKSNDEWSIALSAFSEAVKDYSVDKGNFAHFAKLVIQRRLIDYIRTQSKYNLEVSVSPFVFEVDSDEDDEQIAVKSAIAKKTAKPSDDSIKLEIEAVSQTFAAYGFSFYDLASCSPKADKTKKACAKAAVCMIQNPLLIGNMRDSRTLPIKLIEENTKVPRKILERHRKYIIAAIEIITGDYPFLAEYMRFIREGLYK